MKRISTVSSAERWLAGAAIVVTLGTSAAVFLRFREPPLEAISICTLNGAKVIPKNPGPTRVAVPPPTEIKLGRSSSFGVSWWATTEPIDGYCTTGLGVRPVFINVVPR